MKEFVCSGQMVNTTAHVHFAHVVLFIYIFPLVYFTRYDF